MTPTTVPCVDPAMHTTFIRVCGCDDGMDLSDYMAGHRQGVSDERARIRSGVEALRGYVDGGLFIRNATGAYLSHQSVLALLEPES